MYFKSFKHYHILPNFIKSIIGIGIAGNIIFGTVWCVYFLFRIKVLGKKVCYLKKQTDERCFDELKNAKVDYIKSIFIAAISTFEVLAHLCMANEFVIDGFVKTPNCTGVTYAFKLVHYSQACKVNFAFIPTTIIIFISLIHILTSYLSHAYSGKRITNIMRRERVMFAWLFIQLVCVWCSIFYWPLFILTLPIMAVVALIGHLCLYWKYGRELYSVIRRRERDALFEDVHSHRKLNEMLKSYKNDAILYFLYIFLFIVSLITVISTYIIRIILQGDSLIEKYCYPKVKSRIGTVDITKIAELIDLSFIVTLTFPLLLIHISILRKLIVRMFRKRAAMKNPTRFSRSTLYQPLIGNK